MLKTSHSLLNYLRVVVGAWRDDPRDDAELLARVAEGGEEDGFRVLVCRHGPLVWQICRRILGDTPDAEDAFQTTFLALARKAGQFPVANLAGWLHRVARQAALNVDADARRRRGLEEKLRMVRQPAAEEASRAELYAALDEELAGLPERLRVPLVLRYLEGKTLAEVAQILGCSLTPVTKRLARGEAILRRRLERRGLTIGAVSVGVLLGSTATVSAVPTRLIGSTVRAAATFRAGTLPGGSVEAARAVLGILSSPIAETIMRKSLGIVLACCLGLGSATLVTYRFLSAQPDEPSEAGPAATQVSRQWGPGEAAATRVDCFGDPLPAHALVRMGTTRLWYEAEWGTIPAFSPDGKTLASCIDKMTVCLWDAATGKEIRRLTTKDFSRLTTKDFKGSIVSLGFSPDGKTLIAVNREEQTVWLWEVATGKFLRKQEYQGPKKDNGQSPTVAFLPDGKILGSADFQKSAEEGWGAYVWDLATGKEICQLSEPMKRRDQIRVRAFSPDGKLLATAASENAEKKKAIISLWDVATGKEIRQLTHKDGGVDAVAFSRDGKTLASATDFGEICVWKVATGKLVHLLQEREWPGRKEDPLSYSPDGKTLLGGREGRLWDVGTGKQIRSFGYIYARAALFSPDGKVLATRDQAGAIRSWEVATGKEISPRGLGHRGSISSVAYSPDGMTLASLGGQTVRLWETATGKEIRQLKHNTYQHSGTIAYSPDGKMLVSTELDMLHLWDTATGKKIRQFNGHKGVMSAVFSPDGKKLAVPIDDEKVRLLEVATGGVIHTLPSGVRGQLSVAFSPDGRMLAVPGKDNTVCLREVATGKLICELGGPKQPRGFDNKWVRFLAFSSDGRMLATSSVREDKVHLWEVASGTEICRPLDVPKNNGEGCNVAFSPDCRMLATAAVESNPRLMDPNIHLWDVATGREIVQLIGHKSSVRTIAFSPDGKTLASGSNDTTCLLWDVTSFEGRLKPALARSLPLQPLSKEQLEAAWIGLADRDPAKAYRVLGKMRLSPAQTIALLKARIQPVAPLTNPQQLQRWIADLDDNNFTVRDKAQREIEKLGESAIPALRQALQGRLSLEAKRRLQDLLAQSEPPLVVVSPERLRELRAVQVLESIGTAEARQVLQALAKGAIEALLTQEAQAALTRLAKRSTVRP